MGCSGRYASAAEYDALICAGLDLTNPTVVTEVETFLDIAAADIHAALAAVDACNCALASWATTYLKKLNILDASIIQNCPCQNQISPELKAAWLEWLSNQFEAIRTGKLVLCQDEAGSEYPAWGTAEIGWTEANQQTIIVNAAMRTP